MADENWRSDLKKKTFERHFDIIYVTPSTSIRTLLTILCFVNVNKINKDKLPGSSFGYFLIYIFSLFFFFTLFLFSFASLKSEFLLPFYQRYKLYYVYFLLFFVYVIFSSVSHTSYFCCCWFLYMFYVLYASDGLLRCHEKCYRISSDCYYENGMEWGCGGSNRIIRTENYIITHLELVFLSLIWFDLLANIKLSITCEISSNRK